MKFSFPSFFPQLSPGARRTRSGVVVSLLLLAILIALPSAHLSPNIARLFFITFVWITTSIAWNLLGGFTGQVSFGFAVFYGIGAYTAALSINSGINPYIAFFFAAIAAAMEETGVTSLKQMGVVMKAAQAKLAGKSVDGKAMSEKVRSKLS